MKKRSGKKLALHKETLMHLKQVVGGLYANAVDVETDTDGDTVPSGGDMKCLVSDCSPCP
jgi:hypothetical protein